MQKKWKVITSRQYSEEKVEEFKRLISEESWQAVYQAVEVNLALQIFMENFRNYFNIVFPYKSQKITSTQNNKWITKGLRNSGKRARFLNSLKKKYNLSREAQTYIKKYQFIYKKFLKEAKKTENDRLVKKASDKTKKIRQIINKLESAPYQIEKLN